MAHVTVILIDAYHTWCTATATSAMHVIQQLQPTQIIDANYDQRMPLHAAVQSVQHHGQYHCLPLPMMQPVDQQSWCHQLLTQHAPQIIWVMGQHWHICVHNRPLGINWLRTLSWPLAVNLDTVSVQACHQHTQSQDSLTADGWHAQGSRVWCLGAGHRGHSAAQR